jgi:HEAT repeat protein
MSIDSRLALALGLPDDERVIDPLISVLTSENEDIADRINAADGLVWPRSKKSVAALLTILHDSNEDLRLFIIRTLGKLADKQAIDPLMNVAKDQNESPSVHEAAISALGYVQGKRAFEPLLEALADGDSNIRSAAASALGSLGDRRAVPRLIALLKDEYHVRYAAIQALGKLGDNGALGPLLRMLEDRESDIRVAAVNALGDLGDMGALDALQRMRAHDDYISGEGYEARYAAARAIRKIKRRKRNRLVSLP